MAGKPVGLLSASPGALGGLRSLMAVRQLFTMQLGTLVLPEQFALGGAARAFDADGALVDPKQLEAVRRVIGAVIRVARALG